jgi:sec-independent protein translocase protein TatB
MTFDVAFIGSIGGPELLIVFAVALLVLGPRELPKIVRMAGKLLGELRSISDDFRSEIMSIDTRPVDPPVVRESRSDASDDAVDDGSLGQENDVVEDIPVEIEAENEKKSHDLAG